MSTMTEYIATRLKEQKDILDLFPSKLTNNLIITPIPIVTQMLDSLPKEVWNSKTTFFDPACKSGRYLLHIFYRLMTSPSLIEEFPDERVRRHHILTNQLYGIGVDNTTTVITKRTLYNDLNSGFDNIKYIPNYLELIKNKDPQFYIQALKKEFNTMKFDVIISNPPYQESIGDGVSKKGAKAIYNFFVEKAKILFPTYMSFIIPAKWYCGGLGLDNFRKSMLHDNRIREMHDFPDTEDIFQDVYIMGGVCYFLWDKNKTSNMCKIVTHQHRKESIMIRPLLLKCTDTFIRSNIASTVIQKVMNEEFNSISKYVSALTPFGLPSTEKGSMIKTSQSQVGWWVTGNDTKGGEMNFIERYEIRKNTGYIDKHKVFITKANDNMLSFPYKVLNKPFYGEPNTACNGSFLVVGPFANKETCEKVIAYMCTKFFRFCTQQRKYSQNTSQDTYKFVPLQDFNSTSDIDWTQSIQNIDQQLYKKYNLAQEEINYIEQTIKPMN